ncbi:hypothetical protein [Ideonella sp.]|uniref:hypothetical protein n=1 Tax=Ideonella sp. TaxID=1929293 RepID=UPI0035B3A2A1
MLSAVDGSSAAYPAPMPWHPPEPVSPPQARPTLPAAGSTTVARPASAPTTSGTAGPSFADGLKGTQPRKDDLIFAEMANDVYWLPSGSPPSTGLQSEADLQTQGWTRMQPNGHALRGPDGKDLAIDPASLEDQHSGLRAAIYTDGKGHYVAAFAGTVTDNWGDIRADAGQGIGMRTQQYDQAIALAKKLNQVAGPGNVAFTGHSLGGGLAATASAATGAPAITFNAAGVSNETLRQVGFANPNDARANFQTNGQIRSYSVDGDPLTTVDEAGAPAQLGAQWHSAWKDPQADIRNPKNIPWIHGQPGDGQSYVEVMRNGDMKPGVVKNPYADTGVDGLFSPMGPAGELVPVRGAVLDQLGNAGTTARDSLGDLIQIGGDTASDIRADARRGDPLAFLRVGGELQDGGLDATGALLDNAHDFAGRTVTVVTDHTGEGIRDMGQALHLPQGVTNAGARSVEYAGDATRIGLDHAGDRVEVMWDAAGSAADWTTNRVADAGDAAVDWGHEQWDKAGDTAKKLLPIGLKGLDPRWW